MIPIYLKLTGFLSYRDPAEVDFTAFHLACISGPNGAGKSSLLDAMTWALFGMARKRDESVVNLQSKAAEVVFTFSYEENIYRILRSLPRGKSSSLEFQIADPGSFTSPAGGSQCHWRPLTERSLRDTQVRIEQTLHLDYETFVNASFFLQGRADEFAKQISAKRKEILGSILGLGIWEQYRERTVAMRKNIEKERDGLDGRMQEIVHELAEEPQRKESLASLAAELERLSILRRTQETALESIRQTRASLDKQAELIQALGGRLERDRANLAGLISRREVKESENILYQQVLTREEEVENAYAAWQAARQELARWDSLASQFHDQEKRRQPFLDAINAERVKLEQEKETLRSQQAAIATLIVDQEVLKKEIQILRSDLEEVEAKVGELDAIQKDQQSCREQAAGLRAENEQLKTEMEDLERKIKLLAVEGAACPLCGQPLSQEHRRSTLEDLQAEGTLKGDTYRANAKVLTELAARITGHGRQMGGIESIAAERLRLAGEVAGSEARLAGMQKQAGEWEKSGARRLPEVIRLLEAEKFALEARKSLAKVDKELAALGYDAASHDALRRSEFEQREAETEFRDLESARTAIKPLVDELANINSQIKILQAEVDSQQKEFDERSIIHAAAVASAPDLEAATQAFFNIQEQENKLNQDLGAARQKVNVLDELRERQKRLVIEREAAVLKIGQYKTLERAFGKDGVPALLIEQALPEIEAKANELLDRLSDGSMSVRFTTQSPYKSKKRDDLRETLDILISDEAGVRDYDLYSGGEAFRANFAIRLALSEVLANRKGARLQMLVIDEGFGSQDEQGRQRLIQSINAVQADFAKVLVITHLEELKDAFPTRIEVEKGERGSTIRVL